MQTELVWPDVSGTWLGLRKETYKISFSSDMRCSCVRTDADGQSKTFTLSYDRETHALWWGVRWSQFIDLGSLPALPMTLPWHVGSDTAKEKPAFYWRRADENGRPIHARQMHGGKKSSAAPAKEEQLKAPRAKWAAKAPKVRAA